MLQRVDLIRLDHFRGFSAYWEVPADEETAVHGRWVPGPGADFFHHLEGALGSLPLIAEDLGEITLDVIALREQFKLPGMKILTFAFNGDPRHPFLPHHYTRNCVVYTGTHDNDTARGWYEKAPEAHKDFARRYLASSGESIHWDLIRAAWASVADLAIAPLQDVLGLGSQARMNHPGRASGNWAWRLPADALNEALANRLHHLNFLYDRLIQPSPA
jgi:4-alpha-glucanotransferase